ncbi:hypothetical protein MYSTI_02298 [Myxococcus stipitatus DSM 14675]|uniref:DUF4328 domain-containing protein n=1 Tax=Myxococcus stipitatus (strain DSM 14675 / JCM 12634 / Mx s8) TaxID=1278073 RepID=L7U671_MYXSD|nr:DUF4328 domain-containing protein [Myxococcus stipitatus]AGC43618.1 hypothetical protein MYSTI_02298 [Myxococcus stipitatus DSM 14675]
MQTTPASLPVDAACAHHPDRPAQEVCARCGSFVCEHCKERSARSCDACQATVRQRLLPSARRWAVVATAAISLHAVAEVALLAVKFWLYPFLEGLGLTTTDVMVAYGTAIGTLRALMVATTILGVVGFLRWQYQVFQLASVLDVSQASPRQALLGWFIPGLNLFKPYQLLRDLWRDLGGETSRAHLIRAWWLMGLVSLAVGTGYQLMRRLNEVMFISSDTRAMVNIVHATLFALVTALCIGVVWRIQRQLVQLKGEARHVAT